jgi:hypothetical protein
MVVKELAKIIGKKGSIRLEYIIDPFTIAVFVLELNCLFKKIDPQEAGFTTLPYEGNYRNILGCNILPGIFFQNFVRDSEITGSLVKILLFKIIAIGTIQIAYRPNRFEHDAESGWLISWK